VNRWFRTALGTRLGGDQLTGTKLENAIRRVY
jgi:hypothetical protein